MAVGEDDPGAGLQAVPDDLARPLLLAGPQGHQAHLLAREADLLAKLEYVLILI